MGEFAQVERQLLDQSARLISQEEYLAWEERCNECIESLEEHSRVKRPRLSIGVQQSLVAQIAHLEGLKYSLRGRFVHEGARHSSTGLLWREIGTAFDTRVLTGAVLNSNYIEPRNFLEDAGTIVLEYVRGALRKHQNLKVNTVFNGEFVAGDKHACKSINTRNCELFGTCDLQEWYQRCVIEPTLASLEEFQERDSGWALMRILNPTVNVNKYNPLRAGCHFKLPREILMKKATISVRSEDNACFARAVVAALHPAERNPHRPSSYPHYTLVLNLQDIEFPMSLEQLGKFERQNGISVNVYTFGMEKGSTVFPLRLTSQKRDRHVNLLYTPNHEHGDVGHFVLIKDLSRLVSMQLSRHREKKFICDRCMHYFGSAEKLEAHSLDCGQMNDCAILLPSVGNNLLKFSNHCMKERLPFMVYADLECIIEKTEDNHRMGEMDSKLRAYQHHKVHSIAYYMHCSYDTSLSTYRCRRDADCVSWFVNELENFANFAKPILTSNVPMLDLIPEQWMTFRDATHCHICEEPFKAEDVRVRDHCHLSGRFRGPAHSECNLNYKNAFYIPIVFHNLSGYDSHFIIEEIATAFEGSVGVLPITKEKYISFTKNVEDTADSDSRKCIKLRFIDSYKFLNTSLDKLASFLSADKLKILRSEFETLSIEDFNLLTRKGVFPYEYLDCANKLQDPCLPPRESFYSSFPGETVSKTDYAHAEIMFKVIRYTVDIDQSDAIHV
ncbi:uncharacterized protein LOC143367266 [Andrena cerasifolii]|uniref:uncharacterized protein LOC143367266 n=1 Tax=Andrena cerasifolii TaxID=2819439 RepID=UPI004037B4A5